MDSSTGRPLIMPMDRAWAKRAVFSRLVMPRSPMRTRHQASTRPRKAGLTAKARPTTTTMAKITHSTGSAALRPRPRESSPPATPVSSPPREVYTSLNTGSTRTSSTPITASISTSSTAG